MPSHAGTTGTAYGKTCYISPTSTLPENGTSAWINITSATLCSSCPVITANSGQTSRCSCALPTQGGMIWSASLSLPMNWKSIYRLSPSKTYAWTLLWTIPPPIGCTKKRIRASIDLNDKYGHQKRFLVPSPSAKMGHTYTRKSYAWSPMVMTGPAATSCGAALMGKSTAANMSPAAHMPIKNL